LEDGKAHAGRCRDRPFHRRFANNGFGLLSLITRWNICGTLRIGRVLTMLKSLVALLRCPSCRNLNAEVRLEEFAPGECGHVSDGVLICQGCGAWYPIERDVLEFVPAGLFDQDDLADFCHRFCSQLSSLRLTRPANNGADYAEQRNQRAHFDLYAEEAPGFADYTLTPFIRASSSRYLALWAERLEKPGALLLDVGCGGGISSWPLADGRTLIGFDISRKAVRKAVEGARSRELMGTTTFFVGDASFLPVSDSSFDYAQTFGSLHHVPDPGATTRDIFRILKPGGIYFGVENNKSAFRGIFDLMMKLYPLWVEEAGAQPMFSRSDLDALTAGLSVRIESATSIFLPPHLLNVLGRWAGPVLNGSDRIFSCLPWWRNQGGLLLFTMQKAEAELAAAKS
jgi:SAM-dependent methyltransferase/uncharacterized protein YbaR (Trm112 family)